jgi:hypothetical protein
MENYQIEQDINTVCVTATSFPEGVMAAHDKIRSLVPASAGRRIFGISRPDRTGTIIYKAAIEDLNATPDNGNNEKSGLESFLIPKGTYTSIYIPNFMDDVQQVGTAFKQLLGNPAIDHNGFCLEMYTGEKDVRCMVRLDIE